MLNLLSSSKKDKKTPILLKLLQYIINNKFIMFMKLIPKKTQIVACFLSISASFTTDQMQ